MAEPRFFKRYAGATLLLGAGAALLARRSAAKPRRGHPYLAGAPLLIAHRGGLALAPENTLLALDRALRWWNADLLEVDVHATRDGEAVLIHDATLERTTDGHGAVADLALADVLRCDAGYRFTPDGGATYPFRGRGIRVPTLRQVLQTLPHARINVEIKDARAQEPVWRAVAEHAACHRVLIAAEQLGRRDRFRRYPGPVSAAEQELKAFYVHHRARAAALYVAPADAFQMPERHSGRQVLSRCFVRDAHAKNVAVHVWTVNAPRDMHRLLEWGVDGIVTDRPDLLAAVLHERGARPAAPGPAPTEAEPFLECLLRN